LERLQQPIVISASLGQEKASLPVRILVAVTAVIALAGAALAQTQPTRPTAYAAAPTLPSAFATSALTPCYSSFNRTSPCYSGTIYPSYSAVAPKAFALRTLRAPRLGAARLDKEEARMRIRKKGFCDIGELRKDNHGVWRGEATFTDGKPNVILDLDGNIYSQPKH
jgi:hypothetical protein